MRGMKSAALFMAAALGSLSAWPAHAEEDTTPIAKVVVPIEVENDWNFKSDSPDERHNHLYTKIEPEITVNLWRGLSFYAHSVLETLNDPKPGQDRYFRDHGLYLQDVYLQYRGRLTSAKDDATFRIWGGKFTPAFGIAHDAAPGVFGTVFAEDYELTERIGFGGALTIDRSRLGAWTLQGSLFFLDTIVLSDSIITRRGRTRLTDGGPSNTERLNSFNIALIGNKVFGVDGLRTHFAFVHQAVRNGRDEDGFSAALRHSVTVGKVKVSPLLEAVHFWNAEGVADQRRFYLTSALLLDYGHWQASVSQTLRQTRTPGAGWTRDHLVQLSAGYTFDSGIGVQVGYSHTNASSIGTHTLGVLLTYEFQYGFGRRS